MLGERPVRGLVHGGRGRRAPLIDLVARVAVADVLVLGDAAPVAHPANRWRQRGRHRRERTRQPADDEAEEQEPEQGHANARAERHRRGM